MSGASIHFKEALAVIVSDRANCRDLLTMKNHLIQEIFVIAAEEGSHSFVYMPCEKNIMPITETKFQLRVMQTIQ